MGLLARYRAGDRERVWDELRQLGDQVRAPEFAVDAQAVCDEMALRARHNIDVIVDRLTDHGYRFHDNDDERAPIVPIRPPTADAAPLAHWLSDRFGAVPMTVSSWLRVVGDVWLAGTHPSWQGSAQTDPLVLELEYSRYQGGSARGFYEGELDAWRDPAGEDPSALTPLGSRVEPGMTGGARLTGGPQVTGRRRVPGGPQLTGGPRVPGGPEVTGGPGVTHGPGRTDGPEVTDGPRMTGEPDSARPVFVLPVAPDRLHKANISGGSPYGFRVPDGCAEGIFVAEEAMPFIEYLNRVFACGGFPGPVRDEVGLRIRRELAHGLLPL